MLLQFTGILTSNYIKWIQRLINVHPELINQHIARAINLRKDDIIHWLSPLSTDDYAEYRDASFIQRLAITLDGRSLSFLGNLIYVYLLLTMGHYS